MSETAFINGRDDGGWLRAAAVEYVKAHASDLIVNTGCSGCNGLAITSFAATVTAEECLFPLDSVPGEEDAEILLLRDGTTSVGAIVVRAPDAESEVDEHLAEDVTAAIEKLNAGKTSESVKSSIENGLMPLYELDTEDILSGEERVVVNILEGAWYCASCERPPDSDESGSESDEGDTNGGRGRASRRHDSESEDSAATDDEGGEYEPLVG